MGYWSRRQVVRGSGVVGLGLLAGCGRLPFESVGQRPAQPTAAVYRIGVLGSSSLAVNAPNVAALQRALAERGYVDGANTAFELRWADGQLARLPELAAELVRVPVDVLVVPGQSGIDAAMHATSTIPIVMIPDTDPVGRGLVASLARPGGNVTGLSYLGEQLVPKRMELLKEAVPGLARLGVLALPVMPDLHGLEAASEVLGVELHRIDVERPDDIDPAFENAAKARVDGLLVLASPVTVA